MWLTLSCFNSSSKINGWGKQEAAYRANLLVEGSTGGGIKAEM